MSFLGPFPNPAFKRQVAIKGEPRLVAQISGEMTTGRKDAPLGSPRFAGSVTEVGFSVERSGKDDAQDLSLTLDVKINGTTCLTTQAIIAHVSGEASTNKTTCESGDTGVTEAVVDGDANTYNPGDLISYDLVLTRTATPTTEMRNPVVVVELTPDE